MNDFQGKPMASAKDMAEEMNQPELLDIQLHLRGVLVRDISRTGCPHRCGRRDSVDVCSANEMRPCFYETAHELGETCLLFQEILVQAKEDMAREEAENVVNR